MNFGNIVIMMSRFGSKSGDFAQRGKKMFFRRTVEEEWEKSKRIEINDTYKNELNLIELEPVIKLLNRE